MILAKVAGAVVSTVRADGIGAARYLLVKPCGPSGHDESGGLVALDLMGAGPGELVLVSKGSSTRQTEITRDKPVDAVVMGIVDAVEEKGEAVFRK